MLRCESKQITPAYISTEGAVYLSVNVTRFLLQEAKKLRRLISKLLAFQPVLVLSFLFVVD